MKKFSILVLVLLFSCSEKSNPSLEINLFDLPVSDQSLTPNLYTSENGDVYLSWLERTDEGVAFKFSMLEESEWTQPKLISSGNNWFVNWADFPSFIANENTLSAHWLQKRSEGTYDYDIRISQSQDNGITWSESFIPHNDGISAEHGFVSMRALPNNQNFATWLDGRNTKVSHDHEHGGSGAMTLRAGIFDSQGKMLSDWELDDRTCDCCQTSAAMTSKGMIVAYRDRSENEIRDIYVTRNLSGEWTEPKPVFNDNWEISGCPVNGPSITASEDRVALAWFTAAKGYAEVKMAISSDAGDSFNAPKVISQGNTLGRVGISFLSNDTLAMSWLETNDDIANVMLALFDKNGNEIIRQSIAQTSVARASGFPVISHKGGNVVLAWTESQDGQSVVKSAEIKLLL
ncbi:sialidase family protein [Roseivirga sp. E12]|uniref:sialidase family protein n=1 Tax=Roseivirga sp. E12 TaxID=2819237 RepID=UPI001ABCACEF|nr:sialidase family protein [Roseivirga sp. E12]MBO3700305.1 exo-alpha-sialidase [Roseivirga sp. E12]